MSHAAWFLGGSLFGWLAALLFVDLLRTRGVNRSLKLPPLKGRRR